MKKKENRIYGVSSLLKEHTGLFTDHYELSMAQGYFLEGVHEQPACFDYFFRENPYNGGYTVFTGLHELLGLIQEIRYNEEDIEFLQSIGFDKKFLDHLKDLTFQPDVYAVKEGEIVFPNEPVLRVEAGILEAQILETLVLNVLNFDSLITTKAVRMRDVAGDRSLMDFGLRRAQGLGGLQASVSTVKGGFNQTSNVYSAFLTGIESTGTMAHSWIQSFDDELEAFRVFARHFPGKCILLVDTYDTLETGVPNAIRVAREMEDEGRQLLGIRLDSGDLGELSKKARKMLDDHHLQYVKIVASNKLDEYAISELMKQQAPIDIFGVGTSVITGKGEGALDGVYKLSMANGVPRMKVSDNRSKMTLPGVKSVWRFTGSDGKFKADAIALLDESKPGIMFDPVDNSKRTDLSGLEGKPLMELFMKKGKPVAEWPSPDETAGYVLSGMKRLPEEHRKLEDPSSYPVGLSNRLLDLREELASEFLSKSGKE